MVTTGGLGALVAGFHRPVAELLDHQHRGVVIDGLIDGRHDAHLEQRLDHFRTLNGHLLGKFGHDVGIAHEHVADDRRGRTREAVWASRCR
jgi:hypothetical protein